MLILSKHKFAKKKKKKKKKKDKNMFMSVYSVIDIYTLSTILLAQKDVYLEKANLKKIENHIRVYVLNYLFCILVCSHTHNYQMLIRLIPLFICKWYKFHK